MAINNLQQYPELWAALADENNQAGVIDSPPPTQYQQPQGTPGVDEDAWFHKTEDASIMDAIGKKWDVAFESAMAASAGQEHSQFAAEMLKKKAAEANEARNKLGGAGQFVAGAANLVPIIGTGLINPSLGFATAAGIYSSDIAAERVMEGKDADWGSALGYGTLAAGADALTGGLAGRYRAGMKLADEAANVARRGESLVSPSLWEKGVNASQALARSPTVRKAGVAATEDAVSAMAGEAITNVALDRRWNEGLGMAAMMGIGAGGAIRGPLHAYSKMRGTPTNTSGQATLDNVQELKSTAGLRTGDDFAAEAYSHDNEVGAKIKEAMETGDSNLRNDNIEAAVNMTADLGGKSADLEAIRLAKDFKIPFTDLAFTAKVHDGLGQKGDSYSLKDVFEISDAELQKTGEAQEYARTSRFGNIKATAEGTHKEAYADQFKKSFGDAMGKIKGSFTDNISILENALHQETFGNPNPDKTVVRRLNQAISDASDLKARMEDYTGREKTDVATSIELTSKRLMKELADLGLINKMVGLDGKPGNYNPVRDIMVVDRLERMARANVPNVHHATPNKYRNPLLAKGEAGIAMDVGLATMMSPIAPLIRRGIMAVSDEMGAKKSQKTLGLAKKIAADRMDSILESHKSKAIDEGDMNAAAEISKEQLRNAGINPDGPDTTPPGGGSPSGDPLSSGSIVDDMLGKSPEIQLKEQAIAQARAANSRLIPGRPAPTAQQMQSAPLQSVMPEPEIVQPRSAPLNPDKIRQEEAAAVVEEQQLAPELQQAVDEAIAAQEAPRSAPVPAGSPRQLNIPEPAPEVPPSQTSRSLAAQPEMTPEALRQQRQAELAAAMQEEILARQAAQQAEVPADVGTVPEAAPAPDLASQPSRSPEQMKAEAEAQVMAEAEAARQAEAEMAAQQAAQEPAPEAPVERSKVPAREPKQPVKEEPEVAPEPVQEPTKRTSSTELVTRDLKKQKEEFSNMSAKEKAEMLDTDPEKLREMRQAADDLTATNSLIEDISSQQKMSPDVAATYLNEMGGIRGIREAIREADVDITPKKWAERRIREMEAEKAKAVKEKLNAAKEAEVEKPKVVVDPETQARMIADKHIKTRETLDSLGYDKDIVDEALKRSKATDTTVDHDPTIVKNWARTLAKQKLAKARQDAKDADAALAEAAPKPTIKDSVKELDEYVKGIGADDVPDVHKIITEATRHLKSPLTDVKMASVKSRIDNIIKREEQSLADALNGKGRKALDPVAQNKYMAQHARYKSYVDQIAKNKAKIEAEKAAKEAELKEAQAAVVEKTKHYEKLFAESERRMAKLEAAKEDADRLNTQKDQIRERMMEAGATAEEANEFLNLALPYQDKSLSNSQFTRLRDKGIKNVNARKQAETDAVAAKTKETIEQMDDAELEIAAKELTNFNVKAADYASPEVQAMFKNVVDELDKRGQTYESEYMKTFAAILAKGEVRKKQFPDNEKMWVSYDDKKELQRLMNRTEGGSWMGNLQKQLSAHFFDNANKGDKNFVLTEKRIQEMAESGITDTDIVVKPKRSYKDIARRVNKSQKGATGPIKAETTPTPAPKTEESAALSTSTNKYARAAANIEGVINSGAFDIKGGKIADLNKGLDDFKKEAMAALEKGAKGTGAWPTELETAINNLKPRRSRDGWETQMAALRKALRKAKE